MGPMVHVQATRLISQNVCRPRPLCMKLVSALGALGASKGEAIVNPSGPSFFFDKAPSSHSRVHLRCTVDRRLRRFAPSSTGLGSHTSLVWTLINMGPTIAPKLATKVARRRCERPNPVVPTPSRCTPRSVHLRRTVDRRLRRFAPSSTKLGSRALLVWVLTNVGPTIAAELALKVARRRCE
jgi:hypothetical protein